MIGRIYVEYHLILLHTKYTSFRPCGFRELAEIIKGVTKHCFTQNIKALGLMVSEKKIFLCVSYYKSMEANDPPGRGQLGPQVHDWQDL